VFWRTAPDDRPATAAAAIEAIGSTIVFCRTRHGADRLVKQLQRLGTTAAAIHGGRSQAQREHALRSFARGDVRSLVATDVAARGVHVDGVDGVLHFDPPSDSTSYIHRSGRTARAGASGVVVSFVHPAATRATRDLQRDAGVNAAITAVDLDDLAPGPGPVGASSAARHRPPRPKGERGRFGATSAASIPSGAGPSAGGRRRPPTRQRRKASTTN
jgi:superfamily II DNA/RNA helicase